MNPATAKSSSSDIEAAMREEIFKGKFPAGKLLPPTRKLGSEHGVCFETVRRALKALESEGLLVAEPRHGFRVTPSAALPVASRPVAYVTYFRPDLSDAQPINWALSRALQLAAGERDWTVLGAHFGGSDFSRLAEQLSTARAWGVVLDAPDPAAVEKVQAAGLPVVLTNSWFEDIEVDAVVQDNYRGGFQAVRHLVDSGAERIAWIGFGASYLTSRERFAGAAAGMAACGRSFSPEFTLDASEGDRDAMIRELLERPDRPDGICVFWKNLARQVKSIADELGIRVGTDLELVGWTVEEFWEEEHAANFPMKDVPPAVVWSAKDMAGAALERLELRRSGKAGKPLRINVPTRIRTGSFPGKDAREEEE